MLIMNVEKLGKRYFFCLFTEAYKPCLNRGNILYESFNVFDNYCFFFIYHSSWLLANLQIIANLLFQCCTQHLGHYGADDMQCSSCHGMQKYLSVVWKRLGWAYQAVRKETANMNQNVISSCGKYRCCLIFGLVLSHVDALLIRKIAVQVVSWSSK